MYCLGRSLSKSGLVHFGSKNLSFSNFAHKSVIKPPWFFKILQNTQLVVVTLTANGCMNNIKVRVTFLDASYFTGNRPLMC